MEVTEDYGQQDTMQTPQVGAENAGTPERDLKLVASIIQRIKDDKNHHKKAFDRMRRDMEVAMWGADDKEWAEGNYRANIAGRHVKMKTAALYAKNPKAVARRRPTLDFVLWDEDPQSLEMAMQTVTMATQMLQQAAVDPMAPAPPVDPMTGQPQMPPEVMQAQELIADFQQGMARRQMITKLGKTLEIMFEYSLREQKPLDFKVGMKSLVRRTCTTGVGYVELGYQRETGPRPGMTEKLTDARARLDHLRVLAEKAGSGEITEYDGEMAELEHSVRQLESEEEIVVREGLIVDYPQSTKVVPDRFCTSLVGFVGARHLTIEYTYTCEEVQELFGVDVSDSYIAYKATKGSQSYVSSEDGIDMQMADPEKKKDGLVCVWKHFDKASGLVYFVADGYKEFLRPPAAPDVFVEGFWPVYALTFNAVESESELFPPSDVALMLDMQREYNRARQGLREHRQAARPRWVFPDGALGSEDDPMMLAKMKPFEALGLKIDPQAKIQDIFQAFPVPGVDPNLYETNQLFTDMQLVAGAQEAQFGATSNSTATEASIAANASSASDSSSVDDLDAFLSCIARDAGQILMRMMPEERVIQIVGPGGVWPQMSLNDLVSELSLEVEAGSTGKPNQAVEINNWKQMLPFLIQMPGINPMWLARETVRRLDDKLDLTEAIGAGIPSIAMMNQQAQPAQGPNDPNQQGGEGRNNAPRPDGQSGSDAPMGSNRTDGPTPTQRADGSVVTA
jgi:hypothetical protein